MPTFDVVSEVDLQEVRNAVDQASREVATRFDFKDTDSPIELGDGTHHAASVTEDRLTALRQVLEEKLVKRKISLKAIDYGKVEEAATAHGASGGHADRRHQLRQGARTSTSSSRRSGIKGIQSQTQGEQVRVTGKKRDDLQEAMAALKEQDFGIPLQFQNFRD